MKLNSHPSHRGYQGCGCGIPNRANVYVALVIGRDVPGGTETSEVDAYSCSAHEPVDAAQILHPDIQRDGWYVIESTVKYIR